MKKITLPYNHINIIAEDGVLMEHIRTEFKTHTLADGSEITEKIDTIRFRRSSADDCIRKAIREELKKMLKDG